MPFDNDYTLPMFLGPAASIRSWGSLIRSGKYQRRRIAWFGDSWSIVGGGQGSKWLQRFRAAVNSVLFDATLQDLWIRNATTYGSTISSQDGNGPTFLYTSGSAASAAASGEKWPNAGALKQTATANGLMGRINQRFTGGTTLLGAGAWRGLFDESAPFRIVADVLPDPSSGDLKVEYLRRSIVSDYGGPTSGSVIATELVSGADTGSAVKTLEAPAFSPDWSLGTPMFRITSATGGALVDLQSLRIIFDTETENGLAFDPWAESGYRLGNSVNSFQSAYPDIGPIFQLQGYSGVVCNLCYNDAIGTPHVAPDDIGALFEDWIDYIRGIAGGDIPVLMVVNPCPSLDTFSDTVFQDQAQYAAAFAEVAESYSGVAVYNFSGQMSRKGWNEDSQQFVADYPNRWTNGGSAVAGTVYAAGPVFNNLYDSRELSAKFLCLSNHTMSSTNYPGLGNGFDLWRRVQGGCNDSASDGAHPTDSGGLVLAESLLQGFARLMAEGSGGGGSGSSLIVG